MTGVADKAEDAADALLAWIARQAARNTAAASATLLKTELPASDVGLAATEADPNPAATCADSRIKPSADRHGLPGSGEIASAMRLPTPDWLHHTLTISGRPTDLGRFRRAAAGAGVIPWTLNLDRMEEDYFHLLVAAEQRSLSIVGARIFARELREAVASRHDLAVSRVGQSRACPFDLHALIAIPPEILALGPDEPQSRAWLWEHWGTTEALRHVVHDASPSADAKRDEAEATFHLSFWSVDWTPWRALKGLALRWPALRLDIRPSYGPP